MGKKSSCCQNRGQDETLFGWLISQYKPMIEKLQTIDIKRCSVCGKTYRLSWIQFLGCFVLSAAWIILVSVCYAIAGLPGELFAFFLAPLVLEIPKRYLPWKEVENFNYQRWKSRLGLILSVELGIIAGVTILLEVLAK